MFSVQTPPSFHPSATHRNHQNEYSINPFDNILPLHEALLDFNGNKIFNDLELINNLPKPVSPAITPSTIDIPAAEPRPSTSEGVVRKPLQRSNTNTTNTRSNNKYSHTLNLRAVDGRNTNNPPKTKRQRRRHDEIERFYHCGYNGCTKSYGTLNHLNAHVIFQKHGPKRLPSEFKEIREYQRNRKKEDMKMKKMIEEEASSVSGTTVSTPLTTPYDETLPILPNSAPPTQTSFSENVHDVHDMNDDDLLFKLSESGDVGLGEGGLHDLGIPFSAPVTKTSFFGGDEISNDENNTMDFSEAIQNNLSTLTLPENLSEALSLMDKQSTRSSSEDDTVSTVDNIMTPFDNNFFNMIN